MAAAIPFIPLAITLGSTVLQGARMNAEAKEKQNALDLQKRQVEVASAADEGDRLSRFNDRMGSFMAGGLGAAGGSRLNLQNVAHENLEREQGRADLNSFLQKRKIRGAHKAISRNKTQGLMSLGLDTVKSLAPMLGGAAKASGGMGGVATGMSQYKGTGQSSIASMGK